jgi:peptidoglycan/LPS O-acetylase OafA/YrhL
VLGALLFDLAFEWRGRQAFAMLAAVGLLVWPMRSRKPASPAWLARASDLSYPLFVGHFSLLILLGSWWTHHAWPQGPVSALAYLALTTALTWGWALSLQGALNALVTFWTRHFLARTRWA